MSDIGQILEEDQGAAFKPRTKPWSKALQRVHAMLTCELLHSVAADPPAHLAGTPIARRLESLLPIVDAVAMPLRKGGVKSAPWKEFCKGFAIARRELSWPEGASPEEQERYWWAQIHLVDTFTWTTEYMCPLWTHATPKLTLAWKLVRKTVGDVSDEIVEAHGEDAAEAASAVSGRIWNILKRM